MSTRAATSRAATARCHKKKMTTSQTTSSAYDSKDVDDAAQVIGRLIESHTKQREDAAQAGQPSASDLELWQEIAPVLADFNREIEDEAHGRKERFRGRSASSRTVSSSQAKPWMRSSTFWRRMTTLWRSLSTRTAHCTGSSVVSSTFARRRPTSTSAKIPTQICRCTASPGRSQLHAARANYALTVVDWCGAQRLDKQDHKRISIDDPRAVFLVAWYVEVDKQR